jgi:hypothetical protein
LGSKLNGGLNGHRVPGSSEFNEVALRGTFPDTPVGPEVVVPGKRRYRTTAFKLRLIAEADACEKRGELGALLRREGVYHSDLANWRKQKAQGTLGEAPTSRTQRSDPAFEESVRQQQALSREVRELRRQLGRAKQIIEIQKKSRVFAWRDPSGDEPGRLSRGRSGLIGLAQELADPPLCPVEVVCDALGVGRASYYRASCDPVKQVSLCMPGACTQKDRFLDTAPAEVYSTLLDEGVYHCSISTMYRILEDNKEVRERRRNHSRTQHKKPELMATGPNELWSWDITKLLGPAKWTYFYLYVIMDLFLSLCDHGRIQS